MDRWSVFEHCCHPPLPKHRSLEMAGWTRSWVRGQANRDSTTPRSCQKHTTSEQLSSVAPFPVLSMLWTQGMVRRTRAMQHPTRVGCQLAPPLAISKLISNVYRNPIGPKSSTAKKGMPVSSISRKGAASSSAVSEPAPKRKCVGPDPPKVGSKPFAFEKGIRRLRRPPKGVKTKKMDRKKSH